MFKKKKRESAEGAENNGQKAVVGSGGRRFYLRLHVRKKFLLVVAAGAVLLVVGYFVYAQFIRDSGDTTPTAAEQEQGQELSPEFEGLYDKEKQEIENKLAAADTPEKKSAAYIDYANLEGGEGNPDAAVAYAKDAVDAYESADSLGALAFQAKLAGDYQLAAESYGKAAELIRQAGGENSEYEYEIFMQMKRDAEQQDE